MNVMATGKSKLLILSKSTLQNGKIKTILESEGFRVATTESKSSVITRLKDNYDLLILPAEADEQPINEFVMTIRRSFSGAGMIVIVDPSNELAGVDAVGCGADDYLLNDSSPERIVTTVQAVLKSVRMKNELNVFKESVAMSYGYDNIVGLSEPIVEIRARAAKLAPTDIALLINGPSGSGKELLARVMHYHSKRRNHRFAAIDFSAHTTDSARAVMFGPTDDSSTREPTILEEADGGTLFLDNVDAMPRDLQSLTAEFLSDFVICRGTPAERRVDIRVMTSTSRDLSEMVANNEFDSELYSLISEISLQLPALSERVEDIPLLGEYFLRQACRTSKGKEIGLSEEAIGKLLAHHWPGNVRELETCIKRATALCRGDMLEPADITFASASDPVEGRREFRLLSTRGSSSLMDDTQRSLISRALDDNNWNFTRTAAELGIGRTTLWRKVKKYRLTRQTEDVEA